MKFFSAFALCLSVIISMPEGLVAAQTPPVAKPAEDTATLSRKTASTKEELVSTKNATPAKKDIKSLTNEIKQQTDAGIALVLQNIFLSQGGDGNELWRLEATYASISTKDNTTSVEAPVVRYTLGDPALEDYIHVTADQGQVKDNQRFLILLGNVRVRRADQYIIGDMMEYDAKRRIMVFPEGAILGNPLGSGSANTLSWQLDENILRAKGAVDMSFKKNVKKQQTPTTMGKPLQKVDAASKGTQ